MLRLFIGDTQESELQPLLSAANEHPNVEIVGVGHTGREVSRAVRQEDVNALIFPNSLAELCRAIRISASTASPPPPSFIVGSDEISLALEVKASLYGFDGAVSIQDEPQVIFGKIEEIVVGSDRDPSDPLLEDLGLRPGLLAKEFKTTNPDDRLVADLVGAGLPDKDIASITGKNVQDVRNTIERLLHANDLTYRTQLAVLRASSWKVPDFS